MMKFSKILFVVNPISGTIDKTPLIRKIEIMLEGEDCHYQVEYTRGPSHATELSHFAVEQDFDLVVAVGGDGTMHECASVLIHSNTTLGIIPYGSGNGLSRHLGISNNPLNAFDLIDTGEILRMDVCMANDKPFFNIAGLGFDALIAQQFSRLPKRGFWSYVKEIQKNWPNYEPGEYSFECGNEHFTEEALLVSFANGSQYGNNFHVFRDASVTDGMMDICILNKFPNLALPDIVRRMYLGTLHQSSYTKNYRCNEILVKQNSTLAHLDGEPYEAGNNILFKVLPKALNILAPKAVKDNERTEHSLS